jgi:transposase
VGDILPVTWDVDRRGNLARASWVGRSKAGFPWGRQDFLERLAFEVGDDAPARASARGEAETVVSLDKRTLLWRSDLELRSDGEAFHYRYRRELHENGRPIRERRWEERFPRDHQ